MWTPTIGENAGKIWQVLSTKGQTNLSELKKQTGLNDQNLYLALGWLSREYKVTFKQSKMSVLVNLKG